MGGILKFLNHKWFNIVLRNYFELRTSLTKWAIPFVMATFCAQNLHSAPQTPSQALPKMFQKQPSLDYYQFKKQEQIIPELPAIDIKQQEDTGIKIIPETLIILAPKELQSIISIDKYQQEIIGKPKSINELYATALEIEKEFNSKGYPLVRVILPVQELDQEQATIFFKVINGFIEKIDLSKVPKKQLLRTYSYLKPLLNKKSLRLKDMERQLLLASNIAGVKLSSSLTSGTKEGGTKLIIKADHKHISGGINFDNTQSKELGRQQGQARAVISSALGLGETVSLFGLSRPTFKGMSGTGIEVPIRAGGVSISVPVGNKGLTAGVSYLESMTRPGGDVSELGLEANMKSATSTVSYPVIYQRDLALFTRASISWTDEVQQTNAGGVDEDISHDRVTAARVGASFNGCGAGCLGIDAEISKGLELGSRSNSQVGSGTPLSRSTASSNFTHFRLNANYTINPYKDFVLRLNGGGQYTLNNLLNSEQTSITGEQRLSGFTSGSISGDESWYMRGQVNKNFKLSKNLTLSPYVYTAGGTVYLNQPTATERTATTAKSVGIGLEVSGNDQYFFEKNISARVEYSKNWATANIEDVSSVRLNREHLLVTMAMRF